MLPVLENARQTVQTLKQLEMENSQLKATIEQHEVDAKSQGNTKSSPSACYCTDDVRHNSFFVRIGFYPR